MKKNTIKNLVISVAVIFGATYGIKTCKNFNKKELKNDEPINDDRTYSTIAVLKRIKNEFKVKSINNK